MPAKSPRRVFKTAKFSKEAKRDNIDDDELIAFRLLAKSYAGLTELQVAQLVSGKHFVEICHGDEA